VVEVNDEQPKLDPVETFQKYKARREAEADAAAYKWTGEEVRQLEIEAETDNDVALELAAMKPYILASHNRGDWRLAHEMSRVQAAELLQSQNIKGEPWSTLEVRMVMQNDELRGQYSEELKQIQADGNLITGSREDTLRGAVYGFAGESPEEAQRQLRRKLSAIDKRRQADKTISETIGELGGDPEQRIGRDATRVYLRGQLDRAWAHGQSKEYPVAERPGYGELLKRYEALGGKL
jgi:hypothetical protein